MPFGFDCDNNRTKEGGRNTVKKIKSKIKVGHHFGTESVCWSEMDGKNNIFTGWQLDYNIVGLGWDCQLFLKESPTAGSVVLLFCALLFSA